MHKILHFMSSFLFPTSETVPLQWKEVLFSPVVLIPISFTYFLKCTGHLVLDLMLDTENIEEEERDDFPEQLLNCIEDRGLENKKNIIHSRVCKCSRAIKVQYPL